MTNQVCAEFPYELRDEQVAEACDKHLAATPWGKIPLTRANFTTGETEGDADTRAGDEAYASYMASQAWKSGISKPDIVWPNTESSGVRPRLEVAFSPIEPELFRRKLYPQKKEDQLLGSKQVHRQRYVYLVTVVIDEKEQQWSAQQIADQIVEHFNYGVQPDSENIPELFVRMRPRTGPGFSEGREWRLPVVISLEAVVSNRKKVCVDP